MPEGGQITLRAEVDRRNRVAVPVTDTGSGISKENLAKIFDPFSPPRTGEGTGLGLAICHSIVEHTAASPGAEREGAGSTFTVRLPLIRVAVCQSLKKAVNRNARSAGTGEEAWSHPGGRRRASVERYAAECLRSAGYQVDRRL